MTERPAARKTWGEALAAYGDKRAVTMLFLGFSAGLPILLVFGTLSAWLREAGVSRTAIGFFVWATFAYSLKFVWAPVIDRLRLPYLTRAMGRRRGWMLTAQAIISVGIVGMALTDPRTDLPLMALFAVVTAFGSATQDIVIDAFRIEFAPADMQGPTAGMYQLGYRLALLCAGAGALYLAEYADWRTAYFAMAALVSVGVATVFVIREPAARRDAAAEKLEAALAAPLANKGPLGRLAAWFATAVAGPFVDFFARHGWMALVILLFIGAFRLPDITMGVMANPFYLDVGYSKTEIADVSKIYGVIMGIAGALLGGVFVTAAGLHRPLMICAILAALTNLLFYWLAIRGEDLLTLGNCRDAMCLPADPAGARGVAVWHLILTISAENVVGGAAGTVLIAYLSSLTNTAYTATQYALFSSFMSLVGKIVGGASGVIVDGWGYPNFFLYTTAMGLPAVLLLLILVRWQSRRADTAERRAAPVSA